MDDGLRRLLQSAENRKKKRVVNHERILCFREEEEAILRKFAGNCDAAISIRYTDEFIRVQIVGDVLVIADFDRELKRFLQDEDVTVTFQAENSNILMEIVIRCFSVGPVGSSG